MNHLFSIALSLILMSMGFSSSAQISYTGYSDAHITELTSLDSQINSIRVKWNYVKNNELEDAGALQTGWYDDMRKHLWQLFSKKRAIIRLETGKEFFSIEEFGELSPEKQQVVIDANMSLIEQY